MGTYRNIFPVDSDVYVKGSISSTEQLIASATGLLYSEGVPIKAPSGATTSFNAHLLDVVSWTSLGLSPSTTPAYGITFVDANGSSGDPSTSPAVLSLAAPIVGVKKTIIFDTTAAYINTLDVLLGGGSIIGSSGIDTYLAFSSLATVPQSVTLVGITTALWAIESVNSTLLFFGAATGIRGTSIARTS